MPTLADLLTPVSADEREAQLLASLNDAQFPVTDWFPGSVARTIVKMLLAELQDFDLVVPQIVAGGFGGPFQVGDKVYPTRDWLELLAADIYGLTPSPASFAKQRISLWCSVGAGPYTITSGQLTARSGLDDRYSNATGGTVPAGTSTPSKITLDFVAESPGALYNRDIAGTITELVTPLPGLQISNEALPFGGLDANDRATRAGSSTGTITPQETIAGVAPTGLRQFALTIIDAGQVGTASASLAVDAGDGTGVTTTIITPLPASLDLGSGVTIAAANGAQNPSFLVGDVYTFSTPGSPIINAGTDAESDDSLRGRMRARWPALSAVPTEDRYAGWIRQASIDNGYGVTKITVAASTIVAGAVDIRVATTAGAVPGGVVAALQTYLNQRDGITDLATVASASTRNVTAAGTVTVRAATAAATKLAAKLAWLAYVGGLPIGGDPPEGVVRLAELEQALMDAGAVDVSGLTLNAVAANLSLATTEVAVPVVGSDTTNPWTNITWLEVP